MRKPIGPIYKIDSDGSVVGEFDSCKSAGESIGVTTNRIYKAVKGGFMCGGFFWNLKPNKPIQFVKNDLGARRGIPLGYKSKHDTPVYQWDLSGNLVRKYPSTGVCAKALGVPKTTIHSRIWHKCRIDGMILTRTDTPPTQ